MMISKKKMTKLLNANFRKSLLARISEKFIHEKKIREYARYLADTQIITRSQKFKDDKSAGYGFTPINFICAVSKSGEILKKLFEFNTVNHFLREKNGDAAIETLICILAEWAKSDSTISTFDPKAIDDELSKIEKKYVESMKKDQDLKHDCKEKQLHD